MVDGVLTVVDDGSLLVGEFVGWFGVVVVVATTVWASAEKKVNG